MDGPIGRVAPSGGGALAACKVRGPNGKDSCQCPWSNNPSCAPPPENYAHELWQGLPVVVHLHHPPSAMSLQQAFAMYRAQAPTFQNQAQFCGYTMPPFNPPQCVAGVLVPQMTVPPPPMYAVAPPVMPLLDAATLPCRPTELPSHAPMPLPATPNPANQGGQGLAPGIMLVPHQEFLLQSAPSGASATARNVCSTPASASPPNPATAPLTPISKAEAASPPEVLTDGSGIGVSGTAESKALSPGVQSVARPGGEPMERLGSDTADEEVELRVGGNPLRAHHVKTLGWGASGRDGSDTSDDSVSYRMDPVLETEVPRVCHKRTQQGPQSDRTGQHTAHGLEGLIGTQDVDGGGEGYSELCFKPESNSTGTDAVQTSSGPSTGNDPRSADRMEALLRAASKGSDAVVGADSAAQPLRPRPTRVVASSGGESAWMAQRDERAPSAGQKRRDVGEGSGGVSSSKRPRALSAPADVEALRCLRAAVLTGRPDAVRGVLGDQLFEHIRNEILRQQEQHHQQVLELHRIMDEQHRQMAEMSKMAVECKKQPPSDELVKVKQEDSAAGRREQSVALPVFAQHEGLGPLSLAQQVLQPPLGFLPNLDPHMAALMAMPPGMMCAGSVAFPGPPPPLVSGALGMMPGIGPMGVPAWMAGLPAGLIGPSFPGMPLPGPGWCPPMMDGFMPGFPDPAAMLAAFPMPAGGLGPGMPPNPIDPAWQRQMQLQMGQQVNPAGFPHAPGAPPPNGQDAAAKANYGAWMEMAQLHQLQQQQQHLAALQAAPAAPGQSSSVTQDNDTGRGLAKRAARHAARPSAQDPGRRHKEQAPPASSTP